MYIEFIVIYVLLAAVIALSVVNLILIKKQSSNDDTISLIADNQQTVNYSAPSANSQPASEKYSQPDTSADNDRVVFCTKCATQYPASSKTCPSCGAARS